jgi:hypothetical protein
MDDRTAIVTGRDGHYFYATKEKADVLNALIEKHNLSLAQAVQMFMNNREKNQRKESA